MTKEEWIKRCAEQLHERGGIGVSEAIEYATTCYDAEDDINAPEAFTPEEVANEEMSLWDEPDNDEA